MKCEFKETVSVLMGMMLKPVVLLTKVPGSDNFYSSIAQIKKTTSYLSGVVEICKTDAFI